jgi:hypothetical protein
MCDVLLPFAPWGQTGRERTLEFCTRCACQFGYDDTEFTGVLRCRLWSMSETPEWYYPGGRLPEGLGFRAWLEGLLAILPPGIQRDFGALAELEQFARVLCKLVPLPPLVAAGVLEPRGEWFAILRPAELPESLRRRIIGSSWRSPDEPRLVKFWFPSPSVARFVGAEVPRE